MSPRGWVPDTEIDEETREALRTFATPRRGLDGRLYWPSDDVLGEWPPDAVPLSVEQEITTREAAAASEAAAPTPDFSSEERLATEVVRRQAARRAKRTKPAAVPPTRPSRWAHVPLAQLFADAGNALHERSGGVVECGHQPLHGSRGGRCVTINATTGLWWCRSCRRGGDAVTLVMDLAGCTAPEAASQLAQRYGKPIDRGSAASRRTTRRGRRIAPITIR
jgi:hypothetical protein